MRKKIVVVAGHTAEILTAADRIAYLQDGRVISVEQRYRPLDIVRRRKVAES